MWKNGAPTKSLHVDEGCNKKAVGASIREDSIRKPHCSVAGPRAQPGSDPERHSPNESEIGWGLECRAGSALNSMLSPIRFRQPGPDGNDRLRVCGWRERLDSHGSAWADECRCLAVATTKADRPAETPFHESKSARSPVWPHLHHPRSACYSRCRLGTSVWYDHQGLQPSHQAQLSAFSERFRVPAD